MTRPATQGSYTPPDYKPEGFIEWMRTYRVGQRMSNTTDWGYIKAAWARGERVMNPHASK
jgi:hypothetical protein